ncbi:MAG: hypothetical protein MR295_03420 [Ruminococcus bromii]|nr:hypothetical protein [Ruminococcus bromii]
MLEVHKGTGKKNGTGLCRERIGKKQDEQVSEPGADQKYGQKDSGAKPSPDRLLVYLFHPQSHPKPEW